MKEKEMKDWVQVILGLIASVVKFGVAAVVGVFVRTHHYDYAVAALVLILLDMKEKK